MRKLYLLKTFLLACLFSIVGGGMAWAQTDTLDFSSKVLNLTNKQDMTSWSPGLAYNVSVSFNKGSNNSNPPKYYTTGTAVRVYGGNFFTVKTPTGQVLKKIVITFGSDDGSNAIFASEGTFVKDTWTPSESTDSVKFTIDGKSGNRRIKALAITYGDDGGGESSLLPAKLSFSDSTASADLYKQTEFKTPKLTNPNKLAVTYASSDEAVATVDANTGVVTLIGVGSTTITASSEKTETYAAGSASYTLNVTDSSPYFRFAQTVYSVMLITAFTAPTVETNVEGTPTYSSSDPSVATVDSETGAVTLEALGTTTITATLGKYTASYTLTVTPLPATVFAPVTVQSEVVAGGTYMVLNKDGDKAMGVNNSTKFMNAVDVTLDNGLYTGDVDDEGQPYAFQLVASGDHYKFQHGDTYLKYGGSKTNTTLASLSSGDEFLWKIDLKTTYASPIFNKKDSGRQLGYSYNDGDKPRFAAYSTSNSSQYPAVLYRQYSASDLTLTISEAGYATYYSDKAFVVPAGMEATTVTAANNDGTLTMAWEYQAGNIVPAGTAVLLRGEATTYNAIQLTDCTVAAPTGNLLHGSVEAATTTGGAKYYKLTYATIGGQRTLGFFWGAEDGAAFTNAAGKAYLALPAGAAANGYRLDGGDVTAIGQIATDAQGNGQVYSISGVRMDGSKRLPAGIYVINGRKVIVK